MKISIPNGDKEPNCFLFTDDNENRIYVEGKMGKSELFDGFIDSYEELATKTEKNTKEFYKELYEILKQKGITIKFDMLNIIYH